ncbi:hypothetical protein Agub_g6892 [Astrephomene gubernaculifera]|uniref:Uncharacterized protein n=1 Tax=Astrephomene gubernaculifera TaxID=47775 RepID=A0AAD3DQT8_9CHLO|nr:hypothetical protein Agub_g6892 [Astrephomene gubernaculifera]
MWLTGRGYELSSYVGTAAVRNGRADVVRYLLLEGFREPTDFGLPWVELAAQEGRLETLKVLHEWGFPLSDQVLHYAESSQHWAVVGWFLKLVQEGEEVEVDVPGVFQGAASSGHLGLMTSFLDACRRDSVSAGTAEQAWPYDTFSEPLACIAFTCAAEGGCLEALEWLTEQGCPMPEDGKPYWLAAQNGDMATLRCLRRLGCPWGPPGWLVSECVKYVSCCRLPVLQWMLAEGCPADLGQALEAVRVRIAYDGGTEEMLRVQEWLGEQLLRQLWHRLWLE